jgi:hypothetical protein
MKTRNSKEVIMSHNWGPHFIVPSEVFEDYSGSVLLREEFDEDLLQKELGEFGLSGPISRVTNPWYYRKKNTDTWVKIGESDNIDNNFPVHWDTTSLKNGQYEVMGLMHVFVKTGSEEKGIARQNIVEITLKN